MRFFATHNIPQGYGKTAVFRYSVFRSWLAASFFSLIALVFFGLAWGGDIFFPKMQFPSGLLYWGAFVLGGIAWIGWFNHRARKRSSNWLVQIHPDSIWIKFRSHLNHHFPEQDLIVVEIPFSEIDWVRKSKEQVETPDASEQGSDWISFYTYLDLKLNSSKTPQLRDALIAERNRKAPQSGVQELMHELFVARKRKAPVAEIAQLRESIQAEKRKNPGGNKQSRCTHHHYPVRLIDPEILRIEWNGIRPGIKEALSLLQGKTTIESEGSSAKVNWRDLEGQDLDDWILDLAARGKTMQAISLVQQKYGYSTTESKGFVEELLQNR